MLFNLVFSLLLGDEIEPVQGRKSYYLFKNTVSWNGVIATGFGVNNVYESRVIYSSKCEICFVIVYIVRERLPWKDVDKYVQTRLKDDVFIILILACPKGSSGRVCNWLFRSEDGGLV